ncbi:hypothetical protein [Senegalimassilia anaerobia]
MNSVALDFKSISIRVVCITTVTIAAVFLMLALTGCGPSNEERIEQAVSQPLEAIKAKDEVTLTSLFSDDAKQQLSDIGIDPISYISAYLDGFDYALGPINIDKDTATVDLTITCKTTDSIFAALEQKATEDFESGASANNTEEQTQSGVAENTLDLINAAAPVQHDPITVTLHKIDKSWIVDSDINGALLKALQG